MDIFNFIVEELKKELIKEAQDPTDISLPSDVFDLKKSENTISTDIDHNNPFSQANLSKGGLITPESFSDKDPDTFTLGSIHRTVYERGITSLTYPFSYGTNRAIMSPITSAVQTVKNRFSSDVNLNNLDDFSPQEPYLLSPADPLEGFLFTASEVYGPLNLYGSVPYIPVFGYPFKHGVKQKPYLATIPSPNLLYENYLNPTSSLENLVSYVVAGSSILYPSLYQRGFSQAYGTELFRKIKSVTTGTWYPADPQPTPIDIMRSLNSVLPHTPSYDESRKNLDYYADLLYTLNSPAGTEGLLEDLGLGIGDVAMTVLFRSLDVTIVFGPGSILRQPAQAGLRGLTTLGRSVVGRLGFRRAAQAAAQTARRSLIRSLASGVYSTSEYIATRVIPEAGLAVSPTAWLRWLLQQSGRRVLPSLTRNIENTLGGLAQRRGFWGETFRGVTFFIARGIDNLIFRTAELMFSSKSDKFTGLMDKQLIFNETRKRFSSGIWGKYESGHLPLVFTLLYSQHHYLKAQTEIGQVYDRLYNSGITLEPRHFDFRPSYLYDPYNLITNVNNRISTPISLPAFSDDYRRTLLNYDGIDGYVRDLSNRAVLGRYLGNKIIEEIKSDSISDETRRFLNKIKLDYLVDQFKRVAFGSGENSLGSDFGGGQYSLNERGRNIFFGKDEEIPFIFIDDGDWIRNLKKKYNGWSLDKDAADKIIKVAILRHLFSDDNVGITFGVYISQFNSRDELDSFIRSLTNRFGREIHNNQSLREKYNSFFESYRERVRHNLEIVANNSTELESFSRAYTERVLLSMANTLLLPNYLSEILQFGVFNKHRIYRLQLDENRGVIDITSLSPGRELDRAAVANFMSSLPTEAHLLNEDLYNQVTKDILYPFLNQNFPNSLKNQIGVIDGRPIVLQFTIGPDNYYFLYVPKTINVNDRFAYNTAMLQEVAGESLKNQEEFRQDLENLKVYLTANNRAKVNVIDIINNTAKAKGWNWQITLDNPKTLMANLRVLKFIFTENDYIDKGIFYDSHPFSRSLITPTVADDLSRKIDEFLDKYDISESKSMFLNYLSQLSLERSGNLFFASSIIPDENYVSRIKNGIQKYIFENYNNKRKEQDSNYEQLVTNAVSDAISDNGKTHSLLNLFLERGHYELKYFYLEFADFHGITEDGRFSFVNNLENSKKYQEIYEEFKPILKNHPYLPYENYLYTYNNKLLSHYLAAITGALNTAYGLDRTLKPISVNKDSPELSRDLSQLYMLEVIRASRLLDPYLPKDLIEKRDKFLTTYGNKDGEEIFDQQGFDDAVFLLKEISYRVKDLSQMLNIKPYVDERLFDLINKASSNNFSELFNSNNVSNASVVNAQGVVSKHLPGGSLIFRITLR